VTQPGQNTGGRAMLVSLGSFSIALALVLTAPGVFRWFSSVQPEAWDPMAIVSLLLLGVPATILIVWPAAFVATARSRRLYVTERYRYLVVVLGVFITSGLVVGALAMLDTSDIGGWVRRWLVIALLAVGPATAHVAVDLRAARRRQTEGA